MVTTAPPAGDEFHAAESSYQTGAFVAADVSAEGGHGAARLGAY